MLTELPPLRPELEITSGGTDFNKTPTWIIHDPNNNKFYHIGWLEFEMLFHWNASTVDNLVKKINQETTLKINEKDVFEFIDFLSKTCLLQHHYQGIKTVFNKAIKKYDENWLYLLIKNYLFFKIPLFKPDLFLSKTVKNIQWIFNKSTAFFMLIAALL